MSATSNFRDDLQAVVDERHQANHPFIDKWAAGDIARDSITGASCEIWHWISNLLPEAFFNICAKSPQDVIDMELENLEEETDPENPHERLMIRFIEACGIKEEELQRQRGLPTTESWLEWELGAAKDQPWYAAVAGIHIASEAQEPRLFSRVLPALRETYKFSEHDLEFFWLHAEADVEHGGRAFEMLVRHCQSNAEKELAIHYAREGARMKWFFWDGINIHYEMGYPLH
tara:strand:+ start:731 stop:1423 length:693 start_codon:yes stop_codon:yes gene_type:complete